MNKDIIINGIVTNPAWVCIKCGTKHGRHTVNSYATWHIGKCGVCGTVTDVTEPRDFGYLKG